MACNLSDVQIQGTLVRLGAEFSTLDFIQACPFSGGTKEGAGCPTIRAENGRRSSCGKRLAEFAREHPRRLQQTNPGQSPARWKDYLKPATPVRPTKPSAGGSTSSAARAIESSPHQSSLYRRQLAHQIRWKEQVAGVKDRGEHEGRQRDYLFPEDRWQCNLLPQFRQDVLDHLARHEIQRHQFAHHVMSSQVFALNLAAPFFGNPDWLRPLFGDTVREVVDVQAEVVGPKNYLNEPGTRGAKRTSADLGVWVRFQDGSMALHLFEVKFTESGFGECSKGRMNAGACDSDGRSVVRGGGALCPLAGSPHQRSYWRLMRETGVFQAGSLDADGACPFRHGGYQLMRNQLLAAAMLRDPDCGLKQATFSLLLHDDNQEITRLRTPGGTMMPVTRAWSRLLTDPSSFGGIRSAREWIGHFLDHPWLAGWARQMMERYFPMDPRNDAQSPEAAKPEGASLVRPGHLRSARWMATRDFAELKSACDRVVGEGGVYFRPTDRGVVMIILDERAPGYVGFRTSHEDEGYLLAAGSLPPDEASLRRRYRDFRSWLPTVRRESAEERAVIPWLRKALRNRLILPGMGDDWLLLNQEWRFQRDDGTGRKSDILAVHMPTGRLGIVEAKDDRSKRAEAAAQVSEYGRYWQRDARELAPFFTEVLRAMGSLYGNQWAATGTVSQAQAVLFFAFPGLLGLKVERLG